MNNLTTTSYPNITNLQIKIERFGDFSLLFSLVPNIRQLNVTCTNGNHAVSFNDETPPLIHLTNFQLTSCSHGWHVEEVCSLLHLIPNVKYISLEIFAADRRLIDGQQILTLQQLLPHLQQFNYRVYYRTVKGNFNYATTLASWPLSSVECLVDELLYPYSTFVFIQTLSSYSESFTSLPLPGTIITKTMPANKNDDQVEKLDIYGITTLNVCFPVLSRWHRIKKLTIYFSKINRVTIPGAGKQHSSLFVYTIVISLFNTLRIRTEKSIAIKFFYNWVTVIVESI